MRESDRLAGGVVTALRCGQLGVFSELVDAAADVDPAGVIEALAMLAAGAADALGQATQRELSIALEEFATTGAVVRHGSVRSAWAQRL